MNALTRPTVYSADQRQTIINHIDRAVSELMKLRAAYDQSFVYQSIEGEQYTASDLLEASKLAEDAHNQLQIDFLTEACKHIGEPVSTFDLASINQSNDTVLADIRGELSKRVKAELEAA